MNEAHRHRFREEKYREMDLVAIFLALVFLYSLISGRLERTVVTAPMLFTAAGMLTLLFRYVL